MNVKDLFAALEEKDLSSLKQITASIKTFDKEKSLKRSKTFDRSALTLDLIKIPMSIQHFDQGTLKHVESVDRSTPMHIYTLLRSDSSYSNYLETPNVSKDITEQIPNKDSTDVKTDQLSREENTVLTTEELVQTNKSDMPIDTDELDREVKTELFQPESDYIQVSQQTLAGQCNVHLDESDVSQENEIPDSIMGSLTCKQSLLSDSFLVVDDATEDRDSAENLLNDPVIMQLPHNEVGIDNSSTNTDKASGSISLSSRTEDKSSIDSSFENLSFNDKLPLDNSINKLLGGFDNIKDTENLQETPLETPMCSSLREAQVVVSASQSEIGSFGTKKQSVLISEIQSLDTSDDLTVNQAGDQFLKSDSWTDSSLVIENADLNNILETSMDNVLIEDDQPGVSDLGKTTKENIHREDSEGEDITKIIDEALMDSETAEHFVKHVPVEEIPRNKIK